MEKVECGRGRADLLIRVVITKIAHFRAHRVEILLHLKTVVAPWFFDSWETKFRHDLLLMAI